MESMNRTTVYFRGKRISTVLGGSDDSARASEAGRNGTCKKTSSRNYDCEAYSDCLFQASVKNASKLPCKGCEEYVSRYSEEHRNCIEPLLKLVR
jgi:hypothetical protein